MVDRITSACIAAECDTREITPDNFKDIIYSWKPDLIFSETSWSASHGAWRNKLPLPYYVIWKKIDKTLFNILSIAKDRKIPTFFWQKDSDVWFTFYIHITKLFDHILTTDSNIIPRLRANLPSSTTIDTMLFPCQQAFHSFNGFNFKYNQANFVGGYRKDGIHINRAKWLNMIIESCQKTEMKLDVFDRNFAKRDKNFHFPGIGTYSHFHPIQNSKTASIYKDYLISFNANTITNSPTMYSRRLVEILACGGMVLTNKAISVEKLFKDYCYIVENPEQTNEILSRLKNGPSTKDMERARAGAEYISKNHTWTHRIDDICKIAGI
ncbi:MAG: hypothetical protein A2X47_11960 [Lentisphaerae bacterium GWF2_38_69]|nr:MAG: hypothetical protein A2X47_11960 [Lentisphaerae bacterium GWF2_38_69]